MSLVHIQAAVQAAIEGRRWWFSLKAIPFGESDRYRVLVAPYEVGTRGHNSTANTPAEALLSAYLKVLEAEKEERTAAPSRAPLVSLEERLGRVESSTREYSEHLWALETDLRALRAEVRVSGGRSDDDDE